MRISHKYVAIIFLVNIINIFNYSQAHSQPTRYKLSDVKIALYVDNHWLSPSYEVVIHGDGKGLYELDSGYKRELNLSADQIINILNLLYDIRFFNLEGELLGPERAYVDSSGTVRVQRWHIEDSTITKVNIQIGEYEKSIIFDDSIEDLFYLREVVDQMHEIIGLGSRKKPSRNQ